MKWPKLYHRARTGALHEWQVSVEGDEIVVHHGQVGGKLQSPRRKATPKNVGRSNETTAEQQAVIEAEAQHKFQLDRKYSLTPEEAQQDVMLPMLAHPFEKYEKKIKYPLDIQPKLDGCRALAFWDGERVMLMSRGGKEWKATLHINAELEKMLPKGTVLDGEIYLHGKPFQWITARTKKVQPGTEDLEFHVYDVPEAEGDDTLSWEQRLDYLTRLSDSWAWQGVHGEHILIVPGYSAHNADYVKWQHDQFVRDGYEGAIIRTREGRYEYGHRSPSLLKMKSFEDDEFEIVGFHDGAGIEAGLILWTCRNNRNDLTFDVRPRGTHEERAELFKNGFEFVGHKLKVRFFGRSNEPESLPRFPVGVGIRAVEDMDVVAQKGTR